MSELKPCVHCGVNTTSTMWIAGGAAQAGPEDKLVFVCAMCAGERRATKRIPRVQR